MIVLISLATLCGGECRLLWIIIFPASGLESLHKCVVKLMETLAVMFRQQLPIKLRFRLLLGSPEAQYLTE